MKVNTKSQVVIPKQIREQFGIAPGQEVEWQDEDGKLILAKQGVGETIKRWTGKLKFQFPKGIKTTDEFIEEIRGR